MLAAVFSISSPAYSRELSLKSAVHEAIENNPTLRVYKQRLSQASLTVQEAETIRWGELTGGAAIHRTEDHLMVAPIRGPMTPRTMEDMEFDKTRWGFDVTYKIPLYLGGKIPLSIDISRLNRVSTSLALERLNSVVRHNITRLYYAILALNGEEEAIEENLKALHRVLKHTELSIKEGKLPPLNRYKIDFSIRQWEAERDRIVNERAALFVALQTLMGRKDMAVDFQLKSVMIPRRSDLFIGNAGELYAKALNNRSDLKAMKKRVMIAKKKIGLAKSERLPSIFAVGAFQTYDGPTAAFEEEWDVSLRLSIPIFDAGRRRIQVSRANAGYLEEEERLFALRQKVIKEVGEAISHVKTAEALTESFKTQVMLGREVDRVETLKYEKGAGDTDDMLRAKASLAYANSQWVASIYKWLTARSYLAMVVEEEMK